MILFNFWLWLFLFGFLEWYGLLRLYFRFYLHFFRGDHSRSWFCRGDISNLRLRLFLCLVILVENLWVMLKSCETGCSLTTQIELVITVTDSDEWSVINLFSVDEVHKFRLSCDNPCWVIFRDLEMFAEFRQALLLVDKFSHLPILNYLNYIELTFWLVE